MTCSRLARLGIVACGLIALPSSGAGLSPEAWREDLAFLARELPARHKNLYHRVPKGAFDAEVKRIDGALPTMRSEQIRVAFASLLALAKNGHTRIQAFGESARYPLAFRQFGDGIYVVAADEANSAAVGGRLISIAGVPVAELRKRLLPMVLLETGGMAATQIPGFLRNDTILRGTGIVQGDGPVEFVLAKNGREFTAAAAPVPHSQKIEMKGRQGPSPLYLTDTGTAYWFRYLEDRRALYIQYNSCENMKALPFTTFTRQAMEAADRSPVATVVIDLRHNGGGDSEVMNPLVDALRKRPALRRRGRLFVLTGPNTYSSGLLNAWRLRKALHAKLAGEPSTQRPNTYGDVRSFTLPNSKLQVDYCTKYFKLVPGDPESIPVDIPVPLTADDYFAGRDPVLERVLSTARP